MLDIITNLLDVNKIESGLVNLVIQPVNLDVLDEVIEEYQDRAAHKGIILHYRHSQKRESMEESVSVLADKQYLHQILDNLVSNAVKYSPHWKNVWVRVMYRTDASGRRFGRIEVQDEGPGLSEEDKQKLFHKFARLSAQPTGGENSTGLGLSIVKKLVGMQNGNVWCESILGQGATFIVELPAAETSDATLLLTEGAM
jgi:signal transduction histidine kinase